MDINPLLASAERLVALDARVVLHGPEVTEAQLPRLAIDWGLKRIVADILLHNGAMQHVCRKLGFTILQSQDVGESMVKAVKVL